MKSLTVLIPSIAFAAVVGAGIYQLTPVGDFFNGTISNKLAGTESEAVTPCPVEGITVNEDGSCDYSPENIPTHEQTRGGIPTYTLPTLEGN